MHGFVWILSLTCSLNVWFSACAAASSLSLSWSSSCVLLKVLCKLFSPSLLSILFWQFSRRDFCKGNFFYLSRQPFLWWHAAVIQRVFTSWVTLICYLQADVGRYEGAVHLIKALHGRRPDPDLWLQTPPMWVRGLQKQWYTVFFMIYSQPQRLEFDEGVMSHMVLHN